MTSQQTSSYVQVTYQITFKKWLISDEKYTIWTSRMWKLCWYRKKDAYLESKMQSVASKTVDFPKIMSSFANDF